MEEVTNIINHFCQSRGLESSHFKLKWYNASLNNEKFRIECFSEDSLAFVIISQPSMFEKTFLPYVSEIWSSLNKIVMDPLDQCMKKVFNDLKTLVQEIDPEVQCFHDFEIGPNRRPKILVQTAGHVSGAVRFYQENDANPGLLDRKTEQTKMYPVCLHPKFGGWFALRGVFIFPSIQVKHLTMKIPPEILKKSDQVSELLNLYNHHWRDSRFRDCSDNVEETYSSEQQAYFALEPGSQRNSYLAQLLNLTLKV